MLCAGKVVDLEKKRWYRSRDTLEDSNKTKRKLFVQNEKENYGEKEKLLLTTNIDIHVIIHRQ